jgi:hypothetical protein
MPDLPPGLLNAVGTVGVVVAFSWLIALGRLVPRSTLDFTRAVYEVRLAEMQAEVAEWRAAAKVSSEQVGALMKGQETVIHLLESLDKERP